MGQEDICQKLFKMKNTKNIRKYTVPARGSKAWKHLSKKRTVVERVNRYLKGFFKLNNVRYRSGECANIHFDMATLIYNTSKFVADRIKCQLQIKTQVV